MSAGSGAPYAADVFDRPSVSFKRLSPRPADAYPMAIMKGLIVGAVIILLFEYLGDYIRRKIVEIIGAERIPMVLRRPLGLANDVQENYGQ